MSSTVVEEVALATVSTPLPQVEPVGTRRGSTVVEEVALATVSKPLPQVEPRPLVEPVETPEAKATR